MIEYQKLKPTLTIIIPVYNSGKYLRTCLDSILDQKFEDYELIAVNDGSSDNSAQILDDYAARDKRIKVMHQQNKGVSRARNKGIELAEGRFITFIDSDDIITPTYLSNFVYDENIGWQLQGQQLHFIDDTSKNRNISPQHTAEVNLKQAFQEAELLRLSRGPCLKLFLTNVIKQHGIRFDETISFGEDAIFVKEYLLKCPHKARTVAASDYLYCHYPSSTSLTSRKHDPRKKYQATKIDYNLFCELEKQMRDFDVVLKQDFIRERTLEMWEELRQSLSSSMLTKQEVYAFWKQVIAELYQDIPKCVKLPTTYKIMALCVKYFDLKIAIAILRKLPFSQK